MEKELIEKLEKENKLLLIRLKSLRKKYRFNNEAIQYLKTHVKI